MSNKGADISHIRKYLNGELDERAMHRLEKEAHDDLFLMDALEGYTAKSNEQKNQLEELNTRLQARISKGKWNMNTWTVVAVAASIAGVMTVGGFWLNKSGVHEQQREAQLITDSSKKIAAKTTAKRPHIRNQTKAPLGALNKIPQKKDETKNVAKVDVLKMVPPVADSILSVTPVAVAQPVITGALKSGFYKKQADTTPVNDVVVSEYNTDKRKTSAAGYITQLKSDLKITPEPDKHLYDGRAVGIHIPTVNDAVMARPQPPESISGTVIDKNSGMPVIGAYVRVEGRNSGTVTDVNGHFTLPQVTGNETLAINFIGYSSRKVRISAKDSVKVALAPYQNQLSEVAIVNKNERQTAHPAEDWAAFKKYIETGAVSPDGNKGTVKLSFIVNSTGSLSDFKVLKGVSDATDKKAIELIQNGPKWIGNANGKPEEVKVKIDFKQAAYKPE